MIGETGQRAARGPAIVVMGVSASGKSTVAAALADQLGLAFADADALHPASNVAKMAAGTPLDDDDRWPWLDDVGARLAAGADGGGVALACSALKRSYRDRLRGACPEAGFVHLDGARALLAARAADRRAHFMPPGLLDSQLATLEPLGDDEAGIVIDVSGGLDDITRAALAWVQRGCRAAAVP